MRSVQLKLSPKSTLSPDRRAACEHCACEKLSRQPGVQQVRLTQDNGQTVALFDYDPRQSSLPQLQRTLRCMDGMVGVDLPESVRCMTVPVEGLWSNRDEHRLEAALNKLPGVMATVCYAASVMHLEFDQSRCPLVDILTQAQALGFKLRFDKAERFGPAAGTSPVIIPGELPATAPAGNTPSTAMTPAGPSEIASPGATAPAAATSATSSFGHAVDFLKSHGNLSAVLAGGILLIAGFIVHLLSGDVPSTFAQALRLTLLAGSVVLTSLETFPEALSILRRFRLDVDVLMFAAAIGAASLGKFEEAAFLLFLFGLGAAGEHIALSRARDAIHALSRVAPETARRLNADGSDLEIPIGQVIVGDRLVIRPFDRLPVDGLVESGTSAIDQAPITGESVPVEKSPGSDVFAGTINGQGRLIVTATKLASESTLARVIRMVEEAQAARSPTELFTERVERRYVPFVFIATALLIVIPPLFLGQWGKWFYQSMAFLTAASPCALAIGTPAAILCGIARAARVGVLIKGGGHLETLGRIDAIAFDKTGTLTAGKPRVTRIIALDASVAEDEILSLAAAVESQVTHPLADAVVAACTQRKLPYPTALDVTQTAGVGVVGQVNQSRITVGKAAEVADDKHLPAELTAQVDELRATGQTAIGIARDGKLIGLIAIADQPRENARMVLAQLKKLGIRYIAMLTGDHHRAAQAVADQLGVEHVHADLLPADKLKLIDNIRNDLGEVAMVGDGVNDAPALARSSCGIAMGAAGADVAMETADIVLMGSDLGRLPEVIGLSRQSRRIIRQNLVIALGVIGIVAPLAALGYAALGYAVLLHEGSTVVVVLNSLRLLRYRAPQAIA